ncbi:DUF421 domain-containing protein [Aureibacillus halotolerans]|uniref:Uncharacterized membrane protein YcaP (DUF421 family) n=1 Tax=Aureibacillus halotolerans TaxID=1508390 RepID=A0A4R6U2V1_9BACI|nr:DUF421 domain-containing protein [Aureibacillus halotolerans]TDQ40321.1 uncharacterized membrane protein YcaP (DUF421 family) [Aureibacillus halotolerans]
MPDWLTIILRSVLILLGLFMTTKLLGKKQLSKLSYFEYIVGITLGDIAGSLSMDSGIQIQDGISAFIIWAFVPLLMDRLALKSQTFRDFADGKPSYFIDHGVLLEEQLKKEKYTTNELLEQLRKKNIFDLNQVETAILEPSGDLSVQLKELDQPYTKRDANRHSEKTGSPITIISDGHIQQRALAKLHLTEDWVHRELRNKGTNPKDVFLAQLSDDRSWYIDFYKDSQSHQAQFLHRSIQQAIIELERYTSENSQPSHYHDTIQRLKRMEAEIAHSKYSERE